MPRNNTQAPGTNPEWERVGATIRQLRIDAGLGLGELAGAVRPEPISYSYLSNIEAGRKRLTGVMATRIARALGVPRITIVRSDYEPEPVPASIAS